MITKISIEIVALVEWLVHALTLIQGGLLYPEKGGAGCHFYMAVRVGRDGGGLGVCLQLKWIFIKVQYQPLVSVVNYRGAITDQ